MSPPPHQPQAQQQQRHVQQLQQTELRRSMRICIAFYETEELLRGLDQLHLALEHAARN
jgi:hypothetical protein